MNNGTNETRPSFCLSLFVFLSLTLYRSIFSSLLAPHRANFYLLTNITITITKKQKVDFSKRGGDEDKSEVVDTSSLLPPSDLLGLAGDDASGAQERKEQPGSLHSSLCYRTIKARNDVLRADNSPAQAADARDAMAKAIYGR